MKWFAEAPSNIALIKYMGKKPDEVNQGVNPSLSYTLDHLKSFVELELTNRADYWEPLIDSSLNTNKLNLSLRAKERFLRHFVFLQSSFHIQENFIIRSANNFPSDCGLASSASSFAALTRCAIQAFADIQDTPLISVNEQAQLSRLGSGSSCRSFFTPWALWNNDGVNAIQLPYPKLIHNVVLIEIEKKLVSSSEAHQRVVTSPLFKNRYSRAEERVQLLLNALNAQEWQAAFEIVWEEFEDMHQLFETANPPFSYITPQCREVLDYLRLYWLLHADGPLVTLDAGPNIHLLYRPDQNFMAEEIQKYLDNKFCAVISFPI